MPIKYQVDDVHRLIVAVAYGTMTDDEVFGYQREVWSQRQWAGYDELVDMSRVSDITLASTDRVQDLAALAAEMDASEARSKLVIFAPADLAFGLARMFQAYRELERRSRKDVAVFRTMKEARAFLRLPDDVSLPSVP
jgi:hypothetical protein